MDWQTGTEGGEDRYVERQSWRKQVKHIRSDGAGDTRGGREGETVDIWRQEVALGGNRHEVRPKKFWFKSIKICFWKINVEIKE